jgi:hypothetical protein
MGTPDFVKFSQVPGTAEDALTRLEFKLLREHGLEYSEFAALRPDTDPDTAAYTGGLDLAKEMVPCRSRQEALSLARGWTAWGVSFLVRQVPGDVHLYLFDFQRDSVGAAISFDSSMVYFKTDDLEKGAWLRRLLIALVGALGCDVCGYGADPAYRVGYVPLQPAVLLGRLRAGELFVMPSPNFHAISVDLVKPDEVNALLEHFPKSQFFRSGVATTGHHILSTLP